MVLQNYFQDIFEALPLDLALNLPVCKENSLEIKFECSNETEIIYNGSEPPLPFANSEVFLANILHSRRLTAVNDGCKQVYEITFNIQNSNFSFNAGDTIGIIPHNIATDVNFILTHLELTSVADTSYNLISSSPTKTGKVPPHIPVKSTLRHVLRCCVDLRCVLKKLFLLALSRHTKDETERKILEYFCSKEGATAYQTHILNRNLSILDLFTIFKTCKPPIQVLLANLPRLLPRPYSIVNSGLIEAKVLKICFSVIVLDNGKKGLTTGWLEEIILNQDIQNRMRHLTITNDCFQGNKVPIYLRKNLSKFSLPDNIERPLILIGPGTGVSPFIGFLEEREIIKRSKPETKLGEAWLFFGCRNPEFDFIYETELKGFVEKEVLQKLCTAFSRVDGDVKYIQDVLKQNCEDIKRLIENNASIYVCGDLKNMAAQVKEAITQCLVDCGKSMENSNKIISDLQKEKRYVVDAWS